MLSIYPFMAPVLLTILFGQSSLSEMLECNVHETAHGTYYSVPAPTCEHPGCSYSWNNATNHVLAHEEDEAQEVATVSNRTLLHTYQCYENISYSCQCNSEDKGTAICETKCAGTGKPRGSSIGAGTSGYHLPLLALCVLLLVIR